MNDSEKLETLANIFGAYINQEPLEDAVEAMVFVSCDDPLWHQRFVEAINCGLERALQGDTAIFGIINRSGYRVDSVEQAAPLLQELHQLYSEKYHRAVPNAD